MKNKLSNFLNLIHKNRFYICFAILAICVFFEISGSSIGIWADMIKSNTKSSDGMLAFASRHIRSDEWVVFTPMMFSQKYDGFHMISSILRGGNTNIFLIYGLPVKSIFQLYRPFQLGFLFLGNAKGLSFFWIARILALFLVSIEFFMILTKENKLLSYLGAIMITLSPIINWWIAVNGIIEIFVFGELAIVLLYKYINNTNFIKRLIYLFFMIICAGGYVMVLYPAWQLPMMYVFFIIAVWVIFDNRKKIKINKKDLISITVAFIIFLLSMIYIFSSSINALKLITNTSYPGARFEYGGGQLYRYITYVIGPILPYSSAPVNTNSCEAALMFGLFPVGIIMALKVLLVDKKKDSLLLFLLGMYVFLSIWCIFGFPHILAKLSLLYVSPSSRSFMAIGFLDVLILIRCLSFGGHLFNKKIVSFVLSIIIALVIIVLVNKPYPNYLNLVLNIVLFLIIVSLVFLCFNFDDKRIKYVFVLEMIVVMLICSVPINPVRRGIGVIYDSNVLKAVQKIDEKEKGLWITEGMSFPVNNYINNAGVANLNGTNVYPNLDVWKKLDPEKKYYDIYNRYAHIQINLCDNEEIKEKFRLIFSDSIEVNISADDLKKLKVKYIFTSNKFKDDKSTHFKKLYDDGTYYVYKVIYIK